MKAGGNQWVDMLEESDDSGDEGDSSEYLMREVDPTAAEKDKAKQRRRRFNLKRLIRVLHISRPANYIMAILGKK